MRFTKMQGAGNDYIYVDCFREPMPDDPAGLARGMADRHFGIGGDGLILICPSVRADARMRMFNADGSEAEMCGNGLRCLAKYVYDHGLCRRESLRIETGAGVLAVELQVEDGRARRVRVDMGEPILRPDRIPTTLPGNTAIGEGTTIGSGAAVGAGAVGGGVVVDMPLEVDGRQLRVAAVSMGNPHCITFVDRLSDDWVLGMGPKIETDPHFPNRVNAEFVEVISPSEVRVRVWERGSGETLACGTGACAVCVAGALWQRTDRKIVAHLPGGDLDLHWAEDNHVYKTGPAVEVFQGDWHAEA